MDDNRMTNPAAATSMGAYEDRATRLLELNWHTVPSGYKAYASPFSGNQQHAIHDLCALLNIAVEFPDDLYSQRLLEAVGRAVQAVNRP